MRVIEINQVIATHRHEWKKWPDTQDRDYGPIFAERWTDVFHAGDVELRIQNRFYPVYSAYISAGDENLPIRFPVINNLCPPSERVLEQQRKDLRAFADCKSILWEHTHQCFPTVACELPDLFKLRTISFGDDCPGSSDVKTFPVAAYFNCLYYSMFIWDANTGALTADEYKKRGVAYTRFAPNVISAGLDKGLRDVGFSIKQKQEMIRKGLTHPDLGFVGFSGEGERAVIMKGLSAAHARQKQLGLSMVIHGVGMPDGVLEPRDPPHPSGLGYPMAPLYANALASVNVPISSIFNCRLADCFFSGTVQFIRDKWGELSRMGFVDGEHYLSFANSEYVLEKIAELKAKPEQAAEMVGRAYEKAKDFWGKNSWSAGFGDIFFDNLDLVLS